MSITRIKDDCINLKVPPNVQLIYIDPPYGPKKEDKYYGVGEDLFEYLEWLMKRIRPLTLGITDYNFIIHVDPKASHYIKIELDKLFGRKSFTNEIIWCYSGPSVARHSFPRKHDVLLWYRIGNSIFNQQRIPYKSLSSAKGSSWGGIENIEEYLERGKLLEDWWIDVPALQRNEAEKMGYPTQKPQKLLTRILKSFTSRSGLVVDPMCGSGAMLKVCETLQRDAFGCDIIDFKEDNSND